MNKLYNNILNYISREVKTAINEQFSVSDMDFSYDEQEYGNNIFNKEINHPYYKMVLDGTVTKDEIKELDSLVGVAIPKDKDELRKIIKFYTKKILCTFIELA